MVQRRLPVDRPAMEDMPALTVFFDGSCPVCSLEISFYRQQPGADRIDFVDVSKEDAYPGLDLSREEAMSRFHVRLPSGELRSGAAAFVEIWKVLPFSRPAAMLARLPGATPLLEVGYRVSQPFRPIAARALRRLV